MYDLQTTATSPMLYSDQLGLPKTNPKQWRLNVTSLGATSWEYLLAKESKITPQTNFVKYLLEIDEFPEPPPTPTNKPLDSAKKGADYLKLLQDDAGIFPCQYKGPSFMTIGYVVSHYYSKTPIAEPIKIELIRFLVNYSHPVDGGWGLHTEDKSTCFGTTMNYICLRLLGLPSDHPVIIKARATLRRMGGAKFNPHWGKIFLALLNLYKWEGVNSIPPELWSLPYALPIHPARWWVHTRAIFLPTGYIMANTLQCEEDELLLQLREEIYLPTEPYERINFANSRNLVCGIDLYFPHTKILDFANSILSKYEAWRPKWILKLTNKRVFSLVLKELENTANLSIAPLSHAFNCIVLYAHEGPNSPNFIKTMDKGEDSLFHGKEGMTLMGTNGSQVWDAAFMVQYFVMAGLADLPEYNSMITKAYLFLIRSQFDTDCVDGSYRDPRNGAWPFSTKEQGYPVSDCTAEAIKAIIMIKNHASFATVADAISDERLYDGIEVLLGLQNLGNFEYGSFATYERIKGNQLLEKLNPAEVFNNIMIEYPYVECSDSSVLGLTYFHKYYPEHKSDEISNAIESAMQFIMKAQDEDGSWYGCWGVCYTYASMFALEAMSTVGLTYLNSNTVKKGCDFLVSKQLPDGGWSESIKSCETHTYVDSPESQIVQTAWAVIGLLLADYPKKEPILRGIKLIMEKQELTGEWQYEGIEGVFNHSCAIEYPAYKFLFSIKALGLYAKKFGNEVITK